jgi:hypothetical protein
MRPFIIIYVASFSKNNVPPNHRIEKYLKTHIKNILHVKWSNCEWMGFVFMGTMETQKDFD